MLVGVESSTLSCTRDSKTSPGCFAELELNGLGVIEFIPVNHRIGDRLPDCHIDFEGDLLGNSEAIHEFRNCGSSFANQPQCG